VPLLTGSSFYCVVGSPIQHSKSPLIHRLFAEQFNLPLQYVRIEVAPEEFVASITALRAAGCRGINVTVPNKSIAYSFATRRSTRAETAQAANTLWWSENDTLHCDNTDGVGLLADLKRIIHSDLPHKRILLLGAGGAAAGVLPALLAHQAQLYVINRTFERAALLAARFSGMGDISALQFSEIDKTAPFDIVINATSAGLNGELLALPPHVIMASTLCYDMSYGSEPTLFQRWAESCGARVTSDGLGMLVEQAAVAFEIWHGNRPVTMPVLNTLRKRLL
jgi:shikimate dehydrogenase